MPATIETFQRVRSMCAGRPKVAMDSKVVPSFGQRGILAAEHVSYGGNAAIHGGAFLRR
jgi:hypothetical protein